MSCISSISLIRLYWYIVIHSIMGMTTMASSVSIYPSAMWLSTPRLSSAGSSSSSSSSSTITLRSEPTVSSNLLPFSIGTNKQPSMISVTTSGNPGPTQRPTPVPQPPVQREQQGVQAMTFGGAIYTTVLASLGMGTCSSSHYTRFYLTSCSCFTSSWYGHYNTLKTDIC